MTLYGQFLKLKYDYHRWQFILKHKEQILVILDANETMIQFLGGDTASLHNHIGNGPGLGEMLAALGIESEYV